MSAFTPIADICSAPAHVRFVPKADIAQVKCWVWPKFRVYPDLFHPQFSKPPGGQHFREQIE
jgi:hypothetical protein